MVNKGMGWVGIIILIVAILYLSKGGLNIGTQAITGAETIVRSGPTSAIAGQTFQLTYTANGVSGNWAASVTDSIGGGCSISGSTNMKFVMISDLPNPLVYTVTTPTSGGTCTFNGDYKFGTYPVTQMPSYSVNVCKESTWTPDPSTRCSGVSFTQTSNCATTKSSTGTKSPICTRPADLCVAAASISNQCYLASGSYGTCAGSWIVTKLTSEDDDCNNQISRAELGNAITDWTTGSFSRDDLGTAIQDWASR